jgi:SET domain-containing protein
MASLEKHLYVKPSIIPGSGNGLFTKKFIPKGTRIAEYKGKITSWKLCDHQDGKNGYIYYVKRYHVIDALAFKKAMARYANDASGLSKVKGISNNCSYSEDGLRVFIDAKKNIPADSEILVNYGKEYWQVIRYTIRLEKKQAKKKEQKVAKKWQRQNKSLQKTQ